MAGETAQTLLANALKRREELRREAETLDHFIDAYQTLIIKTTITDEIDETQLDLYRGTSRRAAQARVAAMMDAARRLMLAENRPMKRGELVKKLQEQGYEIVGGDKNKVFGTNLWRSGRFRPVGTRGYWPLDVAIPKESLADQQ